ncbi:hypothetical protein ACU8KH_01156 [Lachancea thermotolerans]
MPKATLRSHLQSSKRIQRRLENTRIGELLAEGRLDNKCAKKNDTALAIGSRLRLWENTAAPYTSSVYIPKRLRKGYAKHYRLNRSVPTQLPNIC